MGISEDKGLAGIPMTCFPRKDECVFQYLYLCVLYFIVSIDLYYTEKALILQIGPRSQWGERGYNHVFLSGHPYLSSLFLCWPSLTQAWKGPNTRNGFHPSGLPLACPRPQQSVPLRLQSSYRLPLPWTPQPAGHHAVTEVKTRPTVWLSQMQNVRCESALTQRRTAGMKKGESGKRKSQSAVKIERGTYYEMVITLLLENRPQKLEITHNDMRWFLYPERPESSKQRLLFVQSVTPGNKVMVGRTDW